LIEREYRAGNREMRLGAVHAMGRSLDARWMPVLLEQLASDDAEMRFEAVTALGQVGDPSVTTSVLPLLEDEDSADVQLAAVTALGQLGGPIAIKQLTAVLDHPDEAMRAAAEDALEQAQFNADPLGFSLN
jgi:HEAT repeat protein